MIVTTLLFFIIACIVLVLAGSLIVKSLSKLAVFLRMSEFVLAFILLAVATSIPELFVGISAGLMKNTAISLGNVIGSNIVNLTLISGVAALLSRGLKSTSKFIRKDAFWMIAFAALPIILMAIGKKLSRIDGAILVGLFAFYIYRMFKQKRKFHIIEKDRVSKWGALGLFLLFLVMLPVLFYSARYVVFYGSELGAQLMLPSLFIGLFFVSLGTALPELVLGTQAAITRHPEIVLGDTIGSVIVNSSLVLGVASMIYPITAGLFLFLTSSAFMIILCFLFAVFFESAGGLSWKEGVVLLLMYVLFLLVELNLKIFYAHA